MLNQLVDRVKAVCNANRWVHEVEEWPEKAKVTVRVPIGGAGKSENAIVNVWANGTVQVQGKAQAAANVRHALSMDGLI